MWIMKYLSTKVLLILSFFAISICMPAFSEEYYRWQDDKGVWHFTDMPPKEREYEVFKKSNRVTDSEEKSKNRAEETQASTKNAKKCSNEQARLHILTTNPVIQVKEEDGTTRNLTKEEIEQEKALSKSVISIYCG